MRVVHSAAGVWQPGGAALTGPVTVRRPHSGGFRRCPLSFHDALLDVER